MGVFSRSLNYPTILLSLLCLMIVISSFSGMDADRIINYEFIFISVYFLIEKQSLFSRLFNNDRVLINHVTKVILLIWFVVILLSFFTSPYILYEKPNAIVRLWETFMHIVLFFIVRDYLIKYRPNLKVILATIYLPIVITAILFFIYLYKTDLPYASSAWFYHPALNFHIRHTGYQAAAAVAVVMLLIFNNSQQRYFYGLYIINIIL